MASDNEKKTFVLDLDAKGFIEGALHAKGTILELGEAKNLTGLTKGLLEAGVALGAIGVAALALKATFEAVFDAEQIEAVNKQFELLSSNAGISGEALKEGLEKSAAGLVTNNELLQASNKAIVALGSSAQKLPEIMDLARKATAVFGGDLLTNFERLNQAIASGSTRQLKAMGIVIDHEKAIRNYAQSLGITVNAMSEAEKRQAVLNAVLEKGTTAFKGVDPAAREAANSWQLFKTALAEIGEIATIVWAKIAGPQVKNALSWLAEWAKGSKTWFQDHFGEGAEQAAAHTERLKDRINELKVTVIDLEQKHMKFDPIPADTASRIQVASAELKKLEAEYATIKKNKEAEDAKHEEKETPQASESSQDKEKRIASELKFRQELATLKQQRLEDDLALADTEDKVNAIHAEEKLNMEEQNSIKIAQIKSARAQGNIASDAQMNEMIEQQQAIHNDKMRELDLKLLDDRLKAHENAARQAQGFTNAVGAGAVAESAKAQRALLNFANTGAMAFNAFQKRASNALIAIGDGSQDAGEAMKGFMLNSLADIAQAQGELLLASALINPLNAAAGAALLVLSGVLRASAGGKGGGGGGSYGGGGAGGGDYGSSSYGGSVSQQAQDRKSVSITVAGNYFETEQTKTRLVEMVREASDASDFRIASISGAS